MNSKTESTGAPMGNMKPMFQAFKKLLDSVSFQTRTGSEESGIPRTPRANRTDVIVGGLRS